MYNKKEEKVKKTKITIKSKFSHLVLDNRNKSGYNILYKIFGRILMANAKNYTEEMVSEMTTAYTENPTRETVDALAQQFGKTTRSIIAKLSREGVYIAQPRTTKSGEAVVSKSELVSEIADHFGIELPTLVKAGKADLQRLVDAISQ
jgi:glucokinase